MTSHKFYQFWFEAFFFLLKQLLLIFQLRQILILLREPFPWSIGFELRCPLAIAGIGKSKYSSNFNLKERNQTIAQKVVNTAFSDYVKSGRGGQKVKWSLHQKSKVIALSTIESDHFIKIPLKHINTKPRNCQCFLPFLDLLWPT